MRRAEVFRLAAVLLAIVLFALAGLLPLSPARAVDIAGPDKIDAYKMIDHSTPNPAMWEIEPSTGVDLRQAPDGMSITWVAPPGTYKVNAIIVLIDFDKRSWSIQKAAKEVVISGLNPPNPPEPDPQPEPGGKYQVMFLLETADLDNLPIGQRALLGSLTFRRQLETEGHRFQGVYDLDSKGTAPTDLAPWFQAVSDADLPCMLVAPLEGGTIRRLPMPADEASCLKQLQKGGG